MTIERSNNSGLDASHYYVKQGSLGATPDQVAAITHTTQLASAGDVLGHVKSVLSESTGSLQDSFAEAILDHYMPGQEAYLLDQANQLNFSNWAASQYNDLIRDTAGFSGAGSVIDFGQGLSNPSTTTSKGESIQAFPGSYAAASANLANEKGSVAQDLNDATEAVAKIKQILQDLTAPGTPGSDGTAQYLNNPALADQINSLKGALTSELNVLQGGIGRLTQLKSYLDLIEVLPPSTQSGWTPNDHYSVMVKGADGSLSPIAPSDITLITNAENAVVQGTATQTGLDEMSQDLKRQSQNFANQSQTQQMQLQLVMTETQQEWTIVSSALQILNQMYMSLAKAIFSM